MTDDENIDEPSLHLQDFLRDEEERRRLGIISSESDSLTEATKILGKLKHRPLTKSTEQSESSEWPSESFSSSVSDETHESRRKEQNLKEIIEAKKALKKKLLDDPTLRIKFQREAKADREARRARERRLEKALKRSNSSVPHQLQNKKKE